MFRVVPYALRPVLLRCSWIWRGCTPREQKACQRRSIDLASIKISLDYFHQHSRWQPVDSHSWNGPRAGRLCVGPCDPRHFISEAHAGCTHPIRDEWAASDGAGYSDADPAWLTWGMTLSGVVHSWWGATPMLPISAGQTGASGGASWLETIVGLAHISAESGLIVACVLLLVGSLRYSQVAEEDKG